MHHDNLQPLLTQLSRGHLHIPNTEPPTNLPFCPIPLTHLLKVPLCIRSMFPPSVPSPVQLPHLATLFPIPPLPTYSAVPSLLSTENDSLLSSSTHPTTTVVLTAPITCHWLFSKHTPSCLPSLHQQHHNVSYQLALLPYYSISNRE